MTPEQADLLIAAIEKVATQIGWVMVWLAAMFFLKNMSK